MGGIKREMGGIEWKVCRIKRKVDGIRWKLVEIGGKWQVGGIE